MELSKLSLDRTSRKVRCSSLTVDHQYPSTVILQWTIGELDQSEIVFNCETQMTSFTRQVSYSVEILIGL